MAFPWAAAIGGGVAAGTGIMSTAANAQENNWARNFASDMASRDHQWAIEDWLRQNQRDDQIWDRENQKNLEWWNMVNQYNSPAAQMKRFTDAGLNPNLIYGQSNMGGTINAANINRSPVRNSSGANAGTGHLGGFEFFNQIVPTIMGIRKSEADIDLTRSQAEATRKEAAFKDTLNLLSLYDLQNEKPLRLKGMQQEYDYKNQLNPISLQAARISNDEMQKRIENILQSIQESRQRISASRQEQSRANQMLPYQKRHLEESATREVNEGWRSAMEAYGKDLENKAREAGVNPNEMGLMRLLMEMVYGSSKTGKPTYLPGASPYRHK